MKITDLIRPLSEARSPKMTLEQKLRAVKDDQKPDAATVKVLERIAARAEATGLKMVLNDPGEYGIRDRLSDRDIRDGTGVYATHLVVHDDAIVAEIIIDTDNIGGDSRNHERVVFTLEGKPADRALDNKHQDFFQPRATDSVMFNVSDGFVRE